MTSRVRFAPSPTGQLHVGGARTALFNWLFARGTDGKMVLRIEDTDQVRSSRESEESIKADLQWLGLQWDEGPDAGGPGAPYRQSERREHYDAALKQLLDAGHAYLAYESPEELGAMRDAARAEKRDFIFRKPEYSADDLARFEAEGRVPVVRLQAPGHDVHFVDQVLGEITVPEAKMDDFVIRKADGFPTYHMAVVVDDQHMQVTHVLRAQEHLMNTAKHLLIYEALGWEPPQHGHMPLIFSMDGSKMSKRDKAKATRARVRELGWNDAQVAEATGLDEETCFRFRKKKTDDLNIALKIAEATDATLPEIDVVDFRAGGYLPEALVNFLALLGWNPGTEQELFTLPGLVEAFDISRMGKTAAKFDRDKLRWMNAQTIKETSMDRLVAVCRDWSRYHPSSLLHTIDDARLTALLDLYRERIQTLGELEQQGHFFFTRPTTWGPAKAIKKHLLRGDGLQRLARAGEVLSTVEDWTAEGINAALTQAAEAEFEGQMGRLAQPIRVAVAGGPVSPSIDATLVLLGKEETLARISACSTHFAEESAE